MAEHTEQSRIDSKIRCKEFIKDNREDLWGKLWECVSAACQKLNTHFASGLGWLKNDSDSLIRVSGPTERLEGNDARTPELHIHFQRDSNRIVARKNNEQIAAYSIEADQECKSLFFSEVGKGGQYSPLFLSETLVADKFLDMKLDE